MPESAPDCASLRVAFAGTPEFARTSLAALIDSPHEVVVVLTQPDRRSGRGRKTTPSAVKTLAVEHGIPVQQPLTLRDPDAQRALAAVKPDILVVVAYGLILPEAVLTLPTLGCINVHGSLLPRWRGAAPVQRALLAGDTETGICWMRMDAGLDTGDVLARERVVLDGHETSPALTERLAQIGADGLSAVLAGWCLGDIEAEPQPSDGVTYAEKLEKAEARLDFGESAIQLDRRIRAFAGWPVAEAMLAGERVRIHAGRLPPKAEAFAEAPEDGASSPPGTIVATSRDALVVTTGDGLIELTSVQKPGGRAVDAGVFAHGRALVGQRFETEQP